MPKLNLKQNHKASPSSVNAALDACDHFCQFMGLSKTKFKREDLSLNQQGGRISISALGLIVRKVGQEAGIEISAHVLRHTCLTNLVRGGNDLVLVAEIGGHKRLETTRRYGPIC